MSSRIIAQLRLCLCAAVFVMLGTIGVAAQNQGLILTIETESLYTDSEFGRQMERQIAEARQELISENQQLEAELISEEQELADRRPTMSSAEFRALAVAFDEKVQRIRATQDEKLRDLTQQRESARQIVFQRAVPVVADILRERGAVMVIDRRNVFLSAESVDITDEAVARLDALFEETPPEDLTPAPEAPETPQPTQDP